MNQKIISFVLTLTAKQSARLYNKAFARMTRGDGYQPFGYDVVTLRMTRPAWLETLQSIATGHNCNVRQFAENI